MSVFTPLSVLTRIHTIYPCICLVDSTHSVHGPLSMKGKSGISFLTVVIIINSNIVDPDLRHLIWFYTVCLAF